MPEVLLSAIVSNVFAVQTMLMKIFFSTCPPMSRRWINIFDRDIVFLCYLWFNVLNITHLNLKIPRRRDRMKPLVSPCLHSKVRSKQRHWLHFHPYFMVRNYHSLYCCNNALDFCVNPLGYKCPTKYNGKYFYRRKCYTTQHDPTHSETIIQKC